MNYQKNGLGSMLIKVVPIPLKEQHEIDSKQPGSINQDPVIHI